MLHFNTFQKTDAWCVRYVAKLEITEFTLKPLDGTVPLSVRRSTGDHVRESENRGRETGCDE